MPTRAETLLALHHAPEILVLVNAWDVVSARAVAATAGCRAVATASAAIAAAHGYPDGEHIPVDLMFATVERIVAAVDLPVTADLEAGYGDPARTIGRAVAAGVAGANLEDGMRALDTSVSAVRAAVAAADGAPFVLNARTDTHLRDTGLDPAARLAEATRRGLAYLEAGAATVFVPGCVEPDEIATLAGAFGPGHLNLMGFPGLPGPAELEALGVARVSFGPAPQRWAMATLTERATELLARG